MTDTKQTARPDIEGFLALVKKATPGPWESDSTMSEGSYGAGDETHEGFKAYEILAEVGGKVVTLCDSLNSDAGEVHEEWDGDEDGDYLSAWDEVARKNFEFIAAAKNTAPDIARYALELESQKPREWRCFHCDEAFNDVDAARDHFGISEMDLPACKLNATEGGIVGLLRKADAELDRYRQEDTALIREAYGMGCKHAVIAREEEEKGYARGLKDYTALATEHDALMVALAKTIATATLLLQNSEGCAVNHYGVDHESQGMPGWLADARMQIEEAATLAKKADAVTAPDQLSRLEAEKNDLENLFGMGAHHDGVVRDRIAAVEAKIADLKKAEG